MAGKIIDISCDAGYLESVLSTAESSTCVVTGCAYLEPEKSRVSIQLFVKSNQVQKTIDTLQSLLPADTDSLVLIVPIDAKIANQQENLINNDVTEGVATREELTEGIQKGAELDFNFVLLAILATVVTVIGLAEDNVAVVIGAMVIAPLLGPNLGLALGAALGDRELMRVAIIANAVGVSITIGLAAIISLVWPPNLESHELITRTQVQPASVALALAAGVAAVQSLVTRLENLLVGVMVAVALVPPATVLGMMIGIQEWQLASGAALLLLINVAAVNFSAQIVLFLNGIRPRTWVAQRKAIQSSWINILVWSILLGLCVLIFILL